MPDSPVPCYEPSSCGQTWYEFKVVAVNIAGRSPASVATQPVQTAPAPGASAAAAAAAAAAATASLAAELSAKSPRVPSAEAIAMGEREDPTLLAQYNQTKRELLQWDDAFARRHHRAATDAERSADPSYQALMARYKKLKHARRKGLRAPDASPSPRQSEGFDAAGGLSRPMTPPPLAHAANGTGSIGSSGGLVAPQPPIVGGGVSATGAAARVRIQPETPVDGAYERPDATPSPPPERAGSSRSKSRKSRSGKKRHGNNSQREREREPTRAASTVNMTVAVKASHPSPRALGASEETFE